MFESQNNLPNTELVLIFLLLGFVAINLLSSELIFLYGLFYSNRDSKALNSRKINWAGFVRK